MITTEGEVLTAIEGYEKAQLERLRGQLEEEVIQAKSGKFQGKEKGVKWN